MSADDVRSVHRIEANGVDFAYLADGPGDGPLALCLHGFPDTAHTWRHLLPDLAAAGYRVVAPFNRGYAPTSLAPDGTYQGGALAADANALHEALGGDGRAVLVGHDWGAIAAYGAATLAPDRWRRVVTMAVPPVQAAMKAFFTYAQMKRSFYVFVFQTPIAELAVAMDDYAFLDGLWADWSPGYDATFDVARVKEAIGSDERIAVAIGAYRTMIDSATHRPEYAEAQQATTGSPPQPTLYLHGAQDGCMDMAGFGDVLPLLSEGSEQVTVDGAGHFLQLERPAEVNAAVLRFIG